MNIAELTHSIRFQPHNPDCLTHGKLLPRDPRDDSDEERRGPSGPCDCWRAAFFRAVEAVESEIRRIKDQVAGLEAYRDGREAHWKAREAYLLADYDLAQRSIAFHAAAHATEKQAHAVTRRDRDTQERDAQGWRNQLNMYATAWKRELGGYLLNKWHEIDALVLTTQLRMKEREEAGKLAHDANVKLAALKAENAALRSEGSKLAQLLNDFGPEQKNCVEALNEWRFLMADIDPKEIP